MEESKSDVEKTEEKEEIKCCQGNKAAVKMLIGGLLVLAGIWAVIAWFGDLLVVVRGCVGLFAILAGLITFAIAKE
ncbi:MAG: hypothetical protein ABH858_00245 [Candidatus Omnitrophota bacterium]